MNKDSLLRIGQVAERLGVSCSSVRRLEGNGRLLSVARTTGGQRLYDPEDVERLTGRLAGDAAEAGPADGPSAARDAERIPAGSRTSPACAPERLRLQDLKQKGYDLAREELSSYDRSYHYLNPSKSTGGLAEFVGRPVTVLGILRELVPRLERAVTRQAFPAWLNDEQVEALLRELVADILHELVSWEVVCGCCGLTWRDSPLRQGPYDSHGWNSGCHLRRRRP